MKLKVLILALLLPAALHAQGIRYDSNVFTAASNVPVGGQAPMYTLPYARVTVCTSPAVGSPCTNTAPIFNDEALTSPMANPITADSQGRFGFWVASGIYVYSVQAAIGANIGTYPITFTMPQGPIGPVGPTGPAGGLNPSAANNFTASQKFQVGPRFGITQYIATGDSITAGTGASCLTCGGSLDTANIYVAKIGYKLGITPTNLGVSGYQAADWVRNVIFPDLNPTPSNNPLVTALMLHNDAHWCPSANAGPTAGCLANAESSMLAGLTWATIPITEKILANAATSCTSGWSSDASVIPSGYASSTIASSCTYSFSTTKPNQAIYIWYRGQDSNTGTASISIDGGSITDTIASAPTSGQCICTIGSGTQTVWAKRYVIVSVGSHTLIDTITSGGAGNISFLGIGISPATLPPTIGPPSIFVGSPIYENGFNDEASTDAFTAQLASQVSLLTSDGLLIGYTNTNQYMNNAVDMSGSNVSVPLGMGDNNSGTLCSGTENTTTGQHPNACGHGHIADMFLGMIQPAPSPASSAQAPSFPSPVATLDNLDSTTGPSITTSQINGGLNWYSALVGSTNPGFATGTAFFQPTTGVFNIAEYQPSSFGAHFFCYYPFGTAITALSQLACPVSIPLNPVTGAGALSAGVDIDGQGYTVQVQTGTGYTFPLVYAPGPGGNDAGLFVHHTSGTSDQMGFFTPTTKPLAVSTSAPNNSLVVNSDGSYSGLSTAPTGFCATNGAWVFSGDGHATFCASGTWITKI
jgi:hypothetical protein